MDILKVLEELETPQECDALLGLVKLNFESDETDLQSERIAQQLSDNELDQMSGARMLLSMKLRGLEKESFENYPVRRKRKRCQLSPKKKKVGRNSEIGVNPQRKSNSNPPNQRNYSLRSRNRNSNMGNPRQNTTSNFPTDSSNRKPHFPPISRMSPKFDDDEDFDEELPPL